MRCGRGILRDVVSIFRGGPIRELRADGMRDGVMSGGGDLMRGSGVPPAGWMPPRRPAARREARRSFDGGAATIGGTDGGCTDGGGGVGLGARDCKSCES